MGYPQNLSFHYIEITYIHSATSIISIHKIKTLKHKKKKYKIEEIIAEILERDYLSSHFGDIFCANLFYYKYVKSMKL
jgi:hypothetical protein